MSTIIGDANLIRTLGDYSKPSHEGYRNTVELPEWNNMVPLRSDTIRLVQNGCSFYGLRSEDPNQHLKDFLKLVDSLDLDGANRERTRLRLFQFFLRDQASNWLERLLAGSISTWEDLTTRFLAQFFPPRMTAKLRNDIVMNQSRIKINKWYQSFALRNFDLEDMEFESTNNGTTAKLPILKLVPQIAQENGTSVTKMSIHVTAEEKTNKKNDVKARSLLLMALPNEHQLTFTTKKTQKILLKQQCKNFSASSAESLDSIFNRLQKIVIRLTILGVMNKPEVETMSIDDLYNNFKIVEQKVKKSFGVSSGAQNLAFMAAPSTSSTNDANTASPQVSTASVSDNVVNRFEVAALEPERPLTRKDQVAIDEDLARNIQAQLDVEIIEEERLERQKQEEANIALIESCKNTQAMMEADRLLAERIQTREREELTDEEKRKLFMELIEKRRKNFAELIAQEKRNRPPTKAHKRTQMSTYLKHMGGYKHKQLMGKSYDEIQKLKRVNTFVAMSSEAQESNEKKEKKQRIEEDKETDEVKEVEEDDEAELKKHLVIKKDDDIAIDVIPLATKPPVIGIDREDLLTLWKLVKTKHGDIRPEDEHERVLWGDFKVMFEPDIRSKVWRDLQGIDHELGSTNLEQAFIKYASSRIDEAEGPRKHDEEREIEWLDVEEPLDLVDTSEESVYESLIKEMPKCSLNYDFRIKKGDPRNLKIPCMIGHRFTFNAYIDVDLPMNIMSLSYYNSVRKNRYEYRGRNFIGLGRDMHVFVGNMSYVMDFTILENIETNIDPSLSHVIFGQPFIEIACLAINRKHGEYDYDRGCRKPSDLEDGFYRDTSMLGPEYVTGIANEGEVTLYLIRRSLKVLRKFHYTIFGGRFNQLSHVSSPLLSKPGEY
ncbi:protein kinase-like domain, concanavalin A-like lectin/glucanase domain protein [Tanacetum coccineum]